MLTNWKNVFKGFLLLTRASETIKYQWENCVILLHLKIVDIFNGEICLKNNDFRYDGSTESYNY